MPAKTNGRQTISGPAGAEKARREIAADLRCLDRVFGERPWRDDRALARARKRARARAQEVIAAEGRGARRTAVLTAAAELLCGMRGELADAPAESTALVRRVLEATELPAVALAREVLRAPGLLNLVPSAAVDAQLTMLVAFAPVRAASLWVLDETGQPSCLRRVGGGAPSRSARELACALLRAESLERPSRPRRLVGAAVGGRHRPLAALVASPRAGTSETVKAFLAEATPMLAAVLERDSLLAANAASERALVGASERKLTRLGFDLHDGPIQEVAVLAEDLRLFRDQLEVVLASAPQRKLVHGRLEDLDAQLVALDSELRRISNEVHAASVLLNRPFSGALDELTRTFEARTGVRPRAALEGDMSLLSGSQQIALLNVIHEALTNIREHSDATRVAITVSAGEQGIEAQITDNGRGFDVEATLVRAARKGRLGLVAMHERVRLLGGQCRIDSRPGGPTSINVALERWEPLVDGRSAREPQRAASQRTN
ncbi:MAG TPA: ATP-binding protein [Solirubrobacteraceae bacterium]|nr:ATP-binding protein [Solirubrobacteraceae bacterium]